MHITTFYSFKGGVGRTQALVNVGVELAKRGRRVLLVDFDLEAPGIDTYPLPKPKEAPIGLVEFVSEYMSTGEAPDASRYIYECRSAGEQGGRLWVMPAGQQDESYARRLSEIDWRSLYSEKGGFLLFEDLKKQWEQTLAPDYVLIDSRTGHSDVSGICTRQLPDSVVVVFFPTDQNLRGLPKVVQDIRLEELGPMQKAINLLFVMSNVPDLDDEDQILESRIGLFAETLRYGQLSAVIHRYDSLALLNQVIFTADRPKSRLAREYHSLADKVIEQNLTDREGALAFILRVTRRSRTAATQMSRTEIESRLKLIRQTHEADKEIIQHLADLRMNEGRFEEAATLWNQLVDMRVTTPHVLLRRAESRARMAQPEGALEDVEAVLRTDNAADYEIARALSLLTSLAPQRLRSVASASAIQHLENDRKAWVAGQLARQDDGLYAAKEIFSQLVSAPAGPTALQEAMRNELSITLMGLGQVEEARDLIAKSPQRETSVAESFNYAMANWACEGVPRPELFERVLALGKDNGSPNYSECMAVVTAILGRPDEAREHLNHARQRLASRPEPALSCWRYRIVSPDEFLKDLDEIRQFIDDKAIRPRFFNQVATPS